MSNYWLDREKDQLYKQHLISMEKELSKEYQRCLKSTKAQLSLLYDEILIAGADGSLLVSDLYKYNRYYDMINNLNKELTKLGSAEIKITEEKLLNMYNYTSKAVANSINFSSGVNPATAERAINALWCADGKHWSDRVWNNKKLLQERIQKGLIDCVSRGASKNELVEQLQNDMNVGFRDADRIARTELTYIQNQATLDKYNEAGIEKYTYLATEDGRTSKQCAAMNGKEFLLKDAKVGVNYPPLHPNCRCTVLAILGTE